MRRFVILFLSLLASVNAWAWGAKGHDVTAYIAECNLTPEAAERIDRVLGGYSIVYFANWLDTASHTPEYAYSKTWHYANIDEGYTFETMPRNPHGDVVSAVEMLVEELRGGRLDPEKEALYLKMLVHLMGDLHCPMHSGRLTDVGGNTLPVRMFGRDTNLHSAWDSSLPEAAHKWSYTEWQNQIDRLTDDEAVLVEAGGRSNGIWRPMRSASKFMPRPLPGRIFPMITWPNIRPSSSSSFCAAVGGWRGC